MDLAHAFDPRRKAETETRFGIKPPAAGGFYGGQVQQKGPTETDPHTEYARPNSKCERIGKECVAALLDRRRFDGRVADLGDLDLEGAYAVAVQSGLHEGITCALKDESDADLTRSNWEQGICVSYMQAITSTVFRGERHRTDGGFGVIDEGRLGAYLDSERMGFQWFVDAAIAIAAMAVQADFSGPDRERGCAFAHRAARDCWCFFSMALVHRGVASRIFFGKSGDKAALSLPSTQGLKDVSDRCDALLEQVAGLGLLSEADVDALTDKVALGQTTEAQLCDDLTSKVVASLVARKKAAGAVARKLAETLQAAMSMMRDADDARDPGGTVEANIFQTCAMLSYWCAELHLGVDFEGLLGLQGTSRAVYRQLSQPMAVATIQKGRSLNQAEAMALLQPAGSHAQADGPPGKAKGAGGRRRQR